MRDFESIAKRYNIISFDVFDTLINRTVDSPSVVFDLVEQEHDLTFPKEIQVTGFRSKRIEAERIARQRNNKEICLDEIYDVLKEQSDALDWDTYKELEIKTEIRCCTVNNKGYAMYSKCLSQKKQIIVISDMYLPQKVIEEILQANGYCEYKALYLSCEVGFTKANGKLFDYCLSNEGIRPDQMLHVGDNLRSDIKNARLKGINAFHLKKSTSIIPGKGLLQHNGLLELFINNTLDTTLDEFGQIGYCCFGPLLYGFIKWIYSEAKKHNYDQILFLSRDGYIMKKAFDLMTKGKNLNSNYMYASRRALQVASIHFESSFDDVMSQMFIPRTVNINWIIRKWGLEPENYRDSIIKVGLNPDYEINGCDIKTNSYIISLFNVLKSDIMNNSRDEYNAFIEYTNSIKLQGNIAIVDIGWYGNMQNSLEKLVKKAGIKADITGYYLGIVPESTYQDIYKMNGFLFERDKNEGLFYEFKYLNSLMELFFMAPHGSTLKYSNQNSDHVILDKFEYENTYTRSMIDNLQRNALGFIEKFSAYYFRFNINGEFTFLNPLYSTLIRPSWKTADCVGELSMWDGRWIPIAQKRNLLFSLLHITKMKADFLNTPWKMGYLKRMLCMPLHYDRIVFLLRSLYKR